MFTWNLNNFSFYRDFTSTWIFYVAVCVFMLLLFITESSFLMSSLHLCYNLSLFGVFVLIFPLLSSSILAQFYLFVTQICRFLWSLKSLGWGIFFLSVKCRHFPKAQFYYSNMNSRETCIVKRKPLNVLFYTYIHIYYFYCTRATR